LCLNRLGGSTFSAAAGGAPAPRRAGLSSGGMTGRAHDWALAGGLVGGVIADALLGDPRRGHPVALFGRAAQAVQDRLYADRRLAGVGYTASCVTLALGPALLADYLTRREPLARLAATAARWQPGAATAGQLDRLLVAFEAWTSAKRDRASDPAALDPQTAFERAGGVDAWTATIQGVSTTPIPAGASPAPCRAFQGEV